MDVGKTLVNHMNYFCSGSSSCSLYSLLSGLLLILSLSWTLVFFVHKDNWFHVHNWGPMCNCFLFLNEKKVNQMILFTAVLVLSSMGMGVWVSYPNKYFTINSEQAGLTAADEEIGDWLRKNYSTKCIILAVNKCESPRKGVMQASEFWSLGWAVSSLFHCKSIKLNFYSLASILIYYIIICRFIL